MLHQIQQTVHLMLAEAADQAVTETESPRPVDLAPAETAEGGREERRELSAEPGGCPRVDRGYDRPKRGGRRYVRQ